MRSFFIFVFMNTIGTEEHPLGFFLPEKAKLLMLGSFPPPKARWSMNFYYPNIQNDMWRIIGLLFFRQPDYFLLPGKKAFNEPLVRRFCTEQGIAIGDTAAEVKRLKENASDKFLEVVKPFPVPEILKKIPACQAVVVTGQKAMDTLLTVIPATEPAVGGYTTFFLRERAVDLYRMPSSSRAYPKPLAEKAAVYRTMFDRLQML